MDPVSLIYYAAICGGLAAFAPQFGGRPARVAVGVIAGLLAASALPYLKSVLGL